MIKKVYRCEPEKVKYKFDDKSSVIFRTIKDIEAIHDDFDYDFFEPPINQAGYEQL